MSTAEFSSTGGLRAARRQARSTPCTRLVLFPDRQFGVVNDHLFGSNTHRNETRWHLPETATHETILTPTDSLIVPASSEVIDLTWNRRETE